MKTSKVITVGFTLATGVLMLAFQNCGRLNIDVADLAAKSNQSSGSANDFNADDVKVQIIESNGDVVNVVEAIPVIDTAGIITVDVRTDQDVAPDKKEQNQKDQLAVGVKDGAEESDNRIVMHETEKETLADNDYSNDEIEQPILVEDTALDEEIEYLNYASSCDQYMKRENATLIDLASFKSAAEITVVQGFTVIFSSNANQYIENLRINRGVGRTVICGVTIGQLIEKVGRLELLDGAEILSLGSMKGKLIDSDDNLIQRKK